MAWSDDRRRVEIGEDDSRRRSPTGRVTFIDATSDGWHIELHAGGARSGIDLAGSASSPVSNADATPRIEATHTVARRRELARLTRRSVRLGEHHYRRSEQRWSDAGKPTADVALWWASRVLHIAIDVHQSSHTFAAATAVNPYDNEFPDINGDGVQLYLSSDNGFGAWILIPERDSANVRIRQLEGWPAAASDHGVVGARRGRISDRRRDRRLRSRGARPDRQRDAAGRERRRGQLVLSGAEESSSICAAIVTTTDRLIPLRLPND